VLCEKEPRASQSQNSIPAKSSFSFGLPKAAGPAEAPTQERVAGGLYTCIALCWQLPGLGREIFFPFSPRHEGIRSHCAATVRGSHTGLPEPARGSKFLLSKFPAASSSFWGQPARVAPLHERSPGTVGHLPGPVGSAGVTPRQGPSGKPWPRPAMLEAEHRLPDASWPPKPPYVCAAAVNYM